MILTRGQRISLPDKVNKRPASLIEILVVLSLLSLVFSMAGFFVYRGIAKERFLSEGHQLLKKMQAARNIAIQMDREVCVKLQHTEEGLLCSIEGDVPFNGNLKVFGGLPKKLKGIKSIALADHSVQSVEIVFSRMGGASPAMPLSLFSSNSSSAKEEEKLVISFYPFPRFMNAADELKNVHTDAFEVLFPKETLE